MLARRPFHWYSYFPKRLECGAKHRRVRHHNKKGIFADQGGPRSVRAVPDMNPTHVR